MWAWVRHADSSRVRAGVHSPKFVLRLPEPADDAAPMRISPAASTPNDRTKPLPSEPESRPSTGQQAVVGTVIIDTL